MLNYWLAPIIAFLIGGIPFGVMIGKMMGVDVRSEGSGNIGATNVYRVLGPKAGSAVFVLDIAKGTAGPLLARALVSGPPTPAHEWLVAGCGIAAVLGHVFSPFLGFKGGKGIATSLGAILGLSPLAGFITFIAWASCLIVTRYVSVGSVAGCFVLPAALVVIHAPTPTLVVSILMSIMAFVKHIPNIKRLMKGTEPKFGQKKPDSPDTNSTATT